MEVEQQSTVMREYYSQLRGKLYQRTFRLKFVAAMQTKHDWYQERMKQIEAVTGVIEGCLLTDDLRRALHYLAVLNIQINQLQNSVDDSCETLLQKHNILLS